MSSFTAADLTGELAARGYGSERLVVVLDSVDSTSTDLFERIGEGAGAGSLVVAHLQTGGRGRQGRFWHCGGPGNVCASLAVKLEGDPALNLPLVPLAAGIAAAEAVRSSCAAEPRLKWPNDLMMNGRKLGGILCEVRDLSCKPVIAVVGLGLNVGPVIFPRELEGVGVDLASVLPPGQVPGAASLIAAWTQGLEDRIRRLEREGSGRGGIVDDWKRLGEPFGRRVRVGELEGVTRGLCDDGRLMLETDDGELLAVPGGIVENVDL